MSPQENPRRWTAPPNWPQPPAGWEPPDYWQPDPAWGPPPAGWQFYQSGYGQSFTQVDRRAKQRRNTKILGIVVGVPLALILLLAALGAALDSGESDVAAPKTAPAPAPSPSPSPSAAFDVVGGAPFENVTAKVLADNVGAAWLPRVRKVGPAGPSLFDVFDLQVDTDLNEDSAADTATGVEICLAFEAAAAPDSGIVVNGLKTRAPETQVDGSLRKFKPAQSKIVANNLGEQATVCSKS